MFPLPPSFLFPGQIIGWRACALSCTRGDLGIKCWVLWLLSMLIAMGSCFEVWSLGFSQTFRSSYHSQSIHILYPALIGWGPSAVNLPLYQRDQVIVKNPQTFLYHCFPQTLIVCLTSGEFLLWDPAELETSRKNYSCHCVGNEWRNSYIFQNLSYDQYEHPPKPQQVSGLQRIKEQGLYYCLIILLSPPTFSKCPPPRLETTFVVLSVTENDNFAVDSILQYSLYYLASKKKKKAKRIYPKSFKH